MSTTAKLVIAGAVVAIVLALLMTNGSKEEAQQADTVTPPAQPSQGQTSPSAGTTPSQSAPSTQSAPSATASTTSSPSSDSPPSDGSTPSSPDSETLSENAPDQPDRVPDPRAAEAPALAKAGPTPEEIYGQAPEVSQEIQDIFDNSPPAILGDNWDEMMENPPELPPEIEEVLENAPEVTYDPEVEAIFRDRPEVVIPSGTQHQLDTVVPIPPPPE